MTIALTSRPREHLIAAGKLYPDAWRQVDEFRAERGHSLPKWPSWCFLPLAAPYSIVSADAGTSCLGLDRVSDVARIGALAAWRVTQGVYRFDPAVYQEIRNTPLAGDLPCEALYRLPEWCVYIETTDMEHPSYGRIYGAFVHLEWDANTERHESVIACVNAG